MAGSCNVIAGDEAVVVDCRLTEENGRRSLEAICDFFLVADSLWLQRELVKGGPSVEIRDFGSSPSPLMRIPDEGYPATRCGVASTSRFVDEVSGAWEDVEVPRAATMVEDLIVAGGSSLRLTMGRGVESRSCRIAELSPIFVMSGKAVEDVGYVVEGSQCCLVIALLVEKGFVHARISCIISIIICLLMAICLEIDPNMDRTLGSSVFLLDRVIVIGSACPRNGGSDTSLLRSFLGYRL